MGRLCQLFRRLWATEAPPVDPQELQRVKEQVQVLSIEVTLLRQAYERRKQQHHAPRARFPDVERYDGRPATYFQFETNLLVKVAVDGEALGSERDWVFYGFSRLSPEAAEKMCAWLRARLDADEPLDWHGFLRELCWTFNRDRILQKAALERLHTMQQGDRSVREYIWDFNEALRDAGAEGQRLSEQMKMHLLEQGLSDEIRRLFKGTDYANTKTLDEYCGTVYLAALTKARAKRRRAEKLSKTI